METLAEKFTNAHFVCDEVPTTVMTINVAWNISRYLKTILKESHVVIIQQSMQKDRTYEDESFEADYFDNIVGVEVHRLKRVMRMTVEIQKLVNTAQKIIIAGELEVVIPKLNREDSSSPIAKKRKLDTVVDIQSVANTVPDAIVDTVVPSRSSDVSAKILAPKKETSSVKAYQDWDEFLRVLSKSVSAKTYLSKLTTTLRFIDGKSGHNIENKKLPHLIYLPETITLEHIDCAKILSLCLDNNVLHEKSPVFIVSSIEPANTLNLAVKACGHETIMYIPYIERRTPTCNEKDKVMGKLNSSVLITDHKSFLGMEHETVVTLVDPMEAVTRHTITEIVSRCYGNLYIFALSHHPENRPGTLLEILKEWETNRLVDVMHVTLETGDKDSETIEYFKETGNIKVNTNSEEYTSLFKLVESFTEDKRRVHLSDEVVRYFVYSISFDNFHVSVLNQTINIS